MREGLPRTTFERCTEPPRLDAALDYCREGDVLVVTKLDRLARSVADVVDIERRLKAKGAELLIISPAMDTASPAGRLMFNVIASIAQFERDIMLAGPPA